MQVCDQYSLFAKKSSNSRLLQLPRPERCVFIVNECSRVIRSLLLLAGDFETNPCANNSDAALAEINKLSSGQTKPIFEIQNLQTQFNATQSAIAGLSKRMADV